MSKSALFGALSNAPVISEVSLAEIKTDPKQPRKHFDEDKLKELATSIEQHGLVQPIIVRDDPDGGYIITAGERRFRACRLLKREKIEAIIRNDENAGIVAIIENLQREDLNPFEEADAVAGLIQERGISQGDAGKLLGKGRLVINQLLKINELSPQIRADGAEVRVPKTLLVELAQIKDEDLQLRLWKRAKDGNLRVADIRKAKMEQKAPAEDGGVSKLTPAGKALVQAQKAARALEKTDLTDSQRLQIQELIQQLTGVLEGRPIDPTPIIE